MGMHAGMGCRCSVCACACIRGLCVHKMSNNSTKAFILLPCKAWAPTLVNILNKQYFLLTNNVMSAFRSALVSNASAQREPGSRAC